MIKAHGKATASGSGAAAIRNSKAGAAGGSFCLVVRTGIEDMLDEAKGMINAITGQ